MNHLANANFWFHYRQLSTEVRELADRCFGLLRANPRHPSLRLKKVGDYWSARVGRDHRALAVEDPVGLAWFWVGAHDRYEQHIQD